MDESHGFFFVFFLSSLPHTLLQGRLSSADNNKMSNISLHVLSPHCSPLRMEGWLGHFAATQSECRSGIASVHDCACFLSLLNLLEAVLSWLFEAGILKAPPAFKH